MTFFKRTKPLSEFEKGQIIEAATKFNQIDEATADLLLQSPELAREFLNREVNEVTIDSSNDGNDARFSFTR